MFEWIQSSQCRELAKANVPVHSCRSTYQLAKALLLIHPINPIPLRKTLLVLSENPRQKKHHGCYRITYNRIILYNWDKSMPKLSYQQFHHCRTSMYWLFELSKACAREPRWANATMMAKRTTNPGHTHEGSQRADKLHQMVPDIVMLFSTWHK